jgi:hypothetical protein
MIELAEENNEKSEKYDFTELDLAVKRWAALTGHENDQDWYRKMKEMYE